MRDHVARELKGHNILVLLPIFFDLKLFLLPVIELTDIMT